MSVATMICWRRDGSSPLLLEEMFCVILWVMLWAMFQGDGVGDVVGDGVNDGLLF